MILPVKYSTCRNKKEVREEYIRLQNGLCQHCGNPIDEEPTEKIKRMRINRRLFPLKFFDFPAHLHHDHDSDMTIGVVHAKCNAVLWQYHGE